MAKFINSLFDIFEAAFNAVSALLANYNEEIKKYPFIGSYDFNRPANALPVTTVKAVDHLRDDIVRSREKGDYINTVSIAHNDKKGVDDLAEGYLNKAWNCLADYINISPGAAHTSGANYPVKDAK